MSETPSLSEWLGGPARLRRVVEGFYRAAREDELLAPLFENLGPEHVERVTCFIDEVFGGAPTYSARYGGHATMVRHHVGKQISEAQRRRWMELWLQSADECGVPDDPEFRSALVGYLEWGSRLAVQNSHLTETPELAAEMPAWGWGVVGGPYRGPT